MLNEAVATTTAAIKDLIQGVEEVKAKLVNV